MQSSDQGKFLSIKNLDLSRGWFYRSYKSDYPLVDIGPVNDYVQPLYYGGFQ